MVGESEETSKREAGCSVDRDVPGGRGDVPADQVIPEGRQGVLAKQDVPSGQGGRERGPERPNNNSSILYTVKHPQIPDVVLGDDQHEASLVPEFGEKM